MDTRKSVLHLEHDFPVLYLQADGRAFSFVRAEQESETLDDSAARGKVSQARRRRELDRVTGRKNVAHIEETLLNSSKFCLQSDEEFVVQGVEWLENVCCMFIYNIISFCLLALRHVCLVVTGSSDNV